MQAAAEAEAEAEAEAKGVAEASVIEAEVGPDAPRPEPLAGAAPVGLRVPRPVPLTSTLNPKAMPFVPRETGY